MITWLGDRRLGGSLVGVRDAFCRFLDYPIPQPCQEGAQRRVARSGDQAVEIFGAAGITEISKQSDSSPSFIQGHPWVSNYREQLLWS